MPALKSESEGVNTFLGGGCTCWHLCWRKKYTKTSTSRSKIKRSKIKGSKCQVQWSGRHRAEVRRQRRKKKPSAGAQNPKKKGAMPNSRPIPFHRVTRSLSTLLGGSVRCEVLLLRRAGGNQIIAFEKFDLYKKIVNVNM